MANKKPDILVLRKAVMGLSTIDYAAELRDRLPEYEIRRAETPAEERELIRDVPVVTAERIDRDLLSHADNIKLFACAASGISHLPLEDLESMGVAVTNAAGIHAPAIAEQVIGYMLVFARGLHLGWEQQQDHRWQLYHGWELKGSTVTIVGLGSIGSAVAKRLTVFDVESIGIRYTPSKGGKTDSVIGFDMADIHDALARTDYLVITTPLTDTTEKLFGVEELATLPTNAVVINVARGGILDTNALVDAIRSRTIRGAALDVTDPEPLPEDHPLWGLDNTFITPHMGGNTPAHWRRLADILAENMERIEASGGYTDLRNQQL